MADNAGSPSFSYSAQQVTEIKHNMGQIAFHMILLGFFFSFCIAVILLSTPRHRKRYLLALQTFAMSLVLICEVMLVYYGFSDTSNVLDRIPDDSARKRSLLRLGVVIDTFGSYAPLIADSVLIYRVLEIHSHRIINASIGLRYLPILPLVVLLLLRAGLLGAAVHTDYVQSSSDWDPVSGATLYRQYLRLRLAEMGLQIIYCLYAFVSMIRQILRLTRGSRLLQKNSSLHIRSRLRFLSEAILMTFFIPLLLQIGSIITMIYFYYDLHNESASIAFSRLLILNYVFSAICCVLATSWSTIREGSARSLASRRMTTTTETSLDDSVGLHEYHSKADDLRLQESHYITDKSRPPIAQRTLLETLFPSQHHEHARDDDEYMEELRTTQFIATQQDGSESHPPFQQEARQHT